MRFAKLRVIAGGEDQFFRVYASVELKPDLHHSFRNEFTGLANAAFSAW